MKFATTLITLLFAISLQAQIPAEGLIACYKFESDASDGINSFDGTLLGGAVTNGTLNIGSNALDALSIPGTLLNQVTAYTVSVDVMFAGLNVNNQSASNTIFSGATPLEDNYMTFMYAKDQLPGGAATLENTLFYLQNDSRYEFNDIDLESGVWYHLSLVRESDAVRFYLDGVEQNPIGGITVPEIEFSLDPDGFIFGQDQDILAGGFVDFQSLNGSLDNLLIYDRALTGEEIWGIVNCDESSFQDGKSNSCNCDDSPLSIHDNDASASISLFPNPTQDLIEIRSFAGSDPIVKLELFDPKGRNLSLKTNSFKSVDLSHLSAGIYIVRLQLESGKIINRKIIKE